MKITDRIIRWLLPCRHVCDLSTLHKTGEDDSDDRVQATCSKCGDVLRGPFGLMFPCEWTNIKYDNENNQKDN